MVVAVVGGGGWWWAVGLLPTAFTCFKMLPNESKVYHFDLILNALPVLMPIQVPRNGDSAAEVLTFGSLFGPQNHAFSDPPNLSPY